MTAYEIPNLRFSAEAGAAIARRRFVRLNAQEQAVQAGEGDIVVGVSSNEASKAGEVLEIYDGIVMVEAGAAVTSGTAVMSDVNGCAVPHDGTSTKAIAGYAMTSASAAGELISVKI